MFHHLARGASRTLGLRALCLAGAASLALIGWAGTAGAQGLGVWEFGASSVRGAPRVYLDEPQEGMAREDFGPPGLPRAQIRAALADEGLTLVSPMRRNGRVYVAEVEDRRGRTLRVVVDARNGEIVERFVRGGPPRPPGALGRDDFARQGMPGEVYSREGLGRQEAERFEAPRGEQLRRMDQPGVESRRMGPPGDLPDRFETGRADLPVYRQAPAADGFAREASPGSDEFGGRRMGALPAPDEDGVLPGLGPQRPRARTGAEPQPNLSGADDTPGPQGRAPAARKPTAAAKSASERAKSASERAKSASERTKSAPERSKSASTGPKPKVARAAPEAAKPGDVTPAPTPAAPAETVRSSAPDQPSPATKPMPQEAKAAPPAVDKKPAPEATKPPESATKAVNLRRPSTRSAEPAPKAERKPEATASASTPAQEAEAAKPKTPRVVYPGPGSPQAQQPLAAQE